ncbi:hypothetical protein SAMN04487765_2062 [Tenacibaculum sp. MAR_2010_89]|uniref:sensor histidine kinase n=1 Tax=Tenacibaculum sp. MAR_2010_89 TaxID=1250198 RepID=UPI0008945F5A|nr:histidine kinase [Tenacibaculum sp. MAR_2010_89]SEE30157.1 hypothetical protein SAMN04487765_2062 [Tenacibaculum sp. MAR_2010_89]
MKIKTNFLRENKEFLIFLFFFSWLFILKNQFGISNSWENFTFHTDAPFWFFLQAIFIFLWVSFIKKRIANNSTLQVSLLKKYLLFFSIGLFSYIVLRNIFGLLISLLFDTYSRNFGSLYLLIYKNIGSAIDFMIFGSFSLVYLYFKENRKFQKQVNDYEISRVKSEVIQLRTQLNPHFLFNNLNVLDYLIEEDKNKASVFLNHFSELYRYSLVNSDKEIVLLQDELAFSEGYFELMKVKYDGYYFLKIDEEVKALKAELPPFCIQVLVENAITHNRGTSKKPIYINIKAIENGIKIINNKIAFKNKPKGNGVALKNMIKQFKLLTKEPILIEDNTECFEIKIPLINLNNYD